MPLVALAPEYQPAHHQVYLDLLERALRHPDTRSVALSGSYGSGKSSVLRALHRWHWDRWRWRRRVIVDLSLSTLDPKLAPAVQAENPAEKEMSNRIQKELVKQLLYRLPPRKTPHSRFPRASEPSWPTGLLVAGPAVVVVVGLVWVVATLAGWQATITDRLDEVGWSAPWLWGGVTVGTVILAVATWRALAGRYALRAGLEAGALTVRLEPTSSSYFDQYLDEIMYFFQVSKTDVVLIEDVDRFGDAVVFDTLRALNTLVNSSGQVGRRVVFVYAIRDSVLGQIGATTLEGDGQPGDATAIPGLPALKIDRANRAKYFDVIIPIVPFVTADNARDLMMQVMTPHVADEADEEGISPALIRLTARHLVDMRTLWSIRNEYEIHVDRLMTSAPNVMPGIREDIVLSLVLLRATSPDAYEDIRLTTSPLDTLTTRWLTLVDQNLDTQTKKLTELRTQLENHRTRENRAERAGQRLDSLRPELLALAVSFVADSVEFSGPVMEANLADPAAWQQIANGATQVATLTAGPRRGTQQVGLSAQMLARLIGMPIDQKAWQDADFDNLTAEIKTTEKEITFLRHHTWDQLYRRTDLKVAAEPGEPAPAGEQINFEDLVRAYAPTALARELIAHGYLPRHFARYASMFYGNVVGVDAAEYISRAIEPGVPIPEYELDEPAVNQILREQKATEDDADLFDDPSIYNLDIVRYLLKYRPAAAKRVAEHLAIRWGAQEQGLATRFFERHEDEAANLAALMGPKWKHALRYTAVDAEVTPSTRLRLVNAVLGAMGADERGDLDADVGRYLSEHYAELPAVTSPTNAARATIVMTTLATAGAMIRDLTELDPTALAAATQVSIYPITATNLRALGGADRVPLDVQRSDAKTRPIYDHALANLADYLDALEQLDTPGTPVQDPAKFATILNDLASAPQNALVDRFVQSASTECRIADLKDAAPQAWPALVGGLRTDPTFGNVQQYITERGIDDVLGGFLTEHRAISTPDETPLPQRIAVSTEILAARETIPTPATRVALAASIAPGAIPIGQVAPEDANLVGPLLAARLLADGPETFDPTLLQHWVDFEAAVAVSGGFGEFSDATTMPVHHLAAMLKSTAIPGDTKAALIVKLASLLPASTTTEGAAIADALTERNERLDRPRIEALRVAGASKPSLVRLIVAQGDSLSLPDLRAILLSMGDDYAKLSAGGSGTVHFAVNKSHQALLDRLVGVTHTGAKVGTTQKHGTKLEARLKLPSP